MYKLNQPVFLCCSLQRLIKISFFCVFRMFLQDSARFWCKNYYILGLNNLLLKLAMFFGNSCASIFYYFLRYMNLEQNWKLVITSLVQVLKCVTFWNVDLVSEKIIFGQKTIPVKVGTTSHTSPNKIGYLTVIHKLWKTNTVTTPNILPLT